MRHEPDPRKWRAAIAPARRASAAPRADVEPLIRLLADVLASPRSPGARRPAPAAAAQTKQGAPQ